MANKKRITIEVETTERGTSVQVEGINLYKWEMIGLLHHAINDIQNSEE